MGQSCVVHFETEALEPVRFAAEEMARCVAPVYRIGVEAVPSASLPAMQLRLSGGATCAQRDRGFVIDSKLMRLACVGFRLTHPPTS